jgi:hypothetical protein
LNHDSGSGFGCRAFPNGIPDEAKCHHDKIIDGQTGNFTFEEVKYEDLPLFTKTLWNKAKQLNIKL